jgi:chromosomal replication initiator protein
MIATKPRPHKNSAPFIGEAAREEVAKIKKLTGETYGFPVADLESRHKQRPLAEARHVAMWLCRRLVKTTQPFMQGLYPISHPDIASLFGFENHGTSMFAVRKVERRRREDADFRLATNDLLFKLDPKLKEVA